MLSQATETHRCYYHRSHMGKVQKEFKIAGQLTFSSPESQVGFAREIQYKTANGLRVKIKDHETEKDKLSIYIICDAESEQEGRFLAEHELQRLSELLSWEFNVPLSSPRIISLEQIKIDGGKSSIVITNTVQITSSLAIRQAPGESRLQSTERMLENQLTEYHTMLLAMYQQAINTISIPLRFLLLFRILEYINQPPGREEKARILADTWIRKMETHVRIEKDITGKEVSIYTFLRDNVHPKPGNPEFPIQMYTDYLIVFQELVRKAIRDEFAIANTY